MTEERNYQNKADKVFTILSEKFVPSWCQTETHWTSKFAGYLWPYNQCGCCLFYRGVTIGTIFGGILGVAFSMLLMLWLLR